MPGRLRSLARALLGRSRFEDEMREELRFHLDRRVEDLVASGLPRDEASRRARLEFGADDRVREECREARGLGLWDASWRNLRFAFRLLRRAPAFTAAAVLTLGLCIGANTAVFSMVDAVLFRALPYPQPDRLAQVVVAFEHEGRRGEQAGQTGLVWEAVRDRASALDAAISASSTTVNLAGEGRVDQVRQHRVSAGFFRALGVAPLVGREFTRDEDAPGGPPVVVLSHGLWTRLFDGRRDLVGRTVLLRGAPHTVVGVMPAHFQPFEPADLWTPARPSKDGEGGGSNYEILARLKPGLPWQQAEAEIQRLGGDIFRTMDIPPGSHAWLHLVPLQAGLASGLRRPLLLLWGAVAAVLLIGCANVASLLLARGATRTREMATRAALGGGRAAVVSQLLTETLVLALIGGAAGLVLGRLLVSWLGVDVLEALGGSQPLRLDGRVLAMTFGMSVATSVVAGLLPAWRVARVDVRRALVEGGGRGIAGGSRQWPRRLLVVGQVALGLALVVGAGLLVRTAIGLYSQPPGFDSRGVLTAQVSLEDARYGTTAAVSGLFDRTLQRLRALPGVEAAGVGLTLPYERALNLGFRPMDGRTRGETTSVVYVTPGFFEALRIRVLQGRDFDESDRAGAAPVAVVNDAFVRYFYRGRDVLQEHIAVARTPCEIVGRVADVQQRPGWGTFGPVAAVPTVYVPVTQLPDALTPLIHTWFPPSFVVRSSAPPVRLIPAAQEALRAVDPLLPFAEFRSMDRVRARSLAGERVRAQLLGGLALLALVLTFVGLYGLVTSSVMERLHEIGIRVALGASRAQVLRQVAGQGVALSLAGIAGGAALALFGVRALRGAVWGIPLADPWTFAGAALGVLLLGVAASLIPALAATRLDPAAILRGD